MKKLVVLFLSAACLVACQETNEAKAEKLIKETMNGIIVNIDTYEPIKTTLDSAFAPLQTAETFAYINNWPSQIKLRARLMAEVEMYSQSMLIYENSYSSYEKGEYARNKEKYENAKKRLDIIEAKLKAGEEKFERLSKEERVFNGYIVYHTYRYVNKSNEKTIGESLFLINKDLTAIESMIDLEDKDLKALFEDYKRQSLIE